MYSSICWKILSVFTTQMESAHNVHTRSDVHLNGNRYQVPPVVWMNSKERYRGRGFPHFPARARFRNIWHGRKIIQQRIAQHKHYSCGYGLYNRTNAILNVRQLFKNCCESSGTLRALAGVTLLCFYARYFILS